MGDMLISVYNILVHACLCSDILAVPVDFIFNDVIKKMFSFHIIVTRRNGLQFK